MLTINLLYLHQVLSALGSTRTPSVVPRWLQSEEPSNDGFFRPFISQSAAHTQACYSNCLLLDSCPGHTGRPYGKRENVSLKFNYLPRAYITFCCFIWVMCCEPQGASVLFPNSPAAAPLTVSARTEPRLRPRSHLLAAFYVAEKRLCDTNKCQIDQINHEEVFRIKWQSINDFIGPTGKSTSKPILSLSTGTMWRFDAFMFQIVYLITRGSAAAALPGPWWENNVCFHIHKYNCITYSHHNPY